ncbi:hypothetical protein B0H12DRAFT_1241583 [Mycena haematopus]|nr:hypothetical protein B0H12DRAFT_1241583 [Mycena haematopus]
MSSHTRGATSFFHPPAPRIPHPANDHPVIRSLASPDDARSPLDKRARREGKGTEPPHPAPRTPRPRMTTPPSTTTSPRLARGRPQDRRTRENETVTAFPAFPSSPLAVAGGRQ